MVLVLSADGQEVELHRVLQYSLQRVSHSVLQCWSVGPEAVSYCCCVSIQGLQPSEDLTYVGCKGYGRCAAVSVSVPAPSTAEKGGLRCVWGHAGP